jgi:hypothetical protein
VQTSSQLGGNTPVTTYANPISGSTATGSSVGGNANSAAAIKYLNQVIKGKQLPYDKETRRNMLSEQSGMASAAEVARNAEMNQSAVAGGASYNDPSLAGARASSMANRQSQNMGAAREIAQNASIANQAQKMAAAKALATFGLAESDRAAEWQRAMMGQPNSQQLANQNTGTFTDGSFNRDPNAQYQGAATPSAQASHLGYTPYSGGYSGNGSSTSYGGYQLGNLGYSQPTGGGVIPQNLRRVTPNMIPPRPGQ